MTASVKKYERRGTGGGSRLIWKRKKNVPKPCQEGSKTWLRSGTYKLGGGNSFVTKQYVGKLRNRKEKVVFSALTWRKFRKMNRGKDRATRCPGAQQCAHVPRKTRETKSKGSGCKSEYGEARSATRGRSPRRFPNAPALPKKM